MFKTAKQSRVFQDVVDQIQESMIVYDMLALRARLVDRPRQGR